MSDVVVSVDEVEVKMVSGGSLAVLRSLSPSLACRWQLRVLGDKLSGTGLAGEQPGNLECLHY